MRTRNAKFALVSESTVCRYTQIMIALLAIDLASIPAPIKWFTSVPIVLLVSAILMRCVTATTSRPEGDLSLPTIFGSIVLDERFRNVTLEPVGIIGKYYRLTLRGMRWNSQPVYIGSLDDWSTVLGEMMGETRVMKDPHVVLLEILARRIKGR
jgi:hypothetical protein